MQRQVVLRSIATRPRCTCIHVYRSDRHSLIFKVFTAEAKVFKGVIDNKFMSFRGFHPLHRSSTVSTFYSLAPQCSPVCIGHHLQSLTNQLTNIRLFGVFLLNVLHRLREPKGVLLIAKMVSFRCQSCRLADPHKLRLLFK